MHSPSEIVNSFGLILDITGVVLIWKFALPQMDTSHGATLILSDKTAPIYARWSRVG